MAETPVMKAKKLEPSVVETTKATRVFNSFLINYVAIFFVILDCFVYCLWPLYVNTNGGYFYEKKKTIMTNNKVNSSPHYHFYLSSSHDESLDI